MRTEANAERGVVAAKFETEPTGDRPFEGNGGVSFLSILRLLLESRALVTQITAIVMVATLLVTLAAQRTYTASATFVPQARASESVVSGLASQLGLAVPGSDPAQSPQFYVDLLRSREILGRAVRSRYEVGGGARNAMTLSEWFSESRGGKRLPPNEAMKRLASTIKTSIHPKTGVIRLEVTTTNPQIGYQIVARLIELLTEFNLETRQSQARSERAFAEQRLTTATAELRNAEDKLLYFLQSNRDFGSSPRMLAERERLVREVGSRQQIYNALTEAYERARIEEVRNTPVLTVIDRPERPTEPDSRGVIRRLALSLLGGLFLALFAVSARYYFKQEKLYNEEDFSRFEGLRRNAISDLKRPWRLFRATR